MKASIEETRDKSVVVVAQDVPDMVVVHTGEKAMIYIPTSSEMWGKIHVRQVADSAWYKESDEDGYWYYCERCGYTLNSGATHHVSEYKFCPHCGARMDGVK